MTDPAASHLAALSSAPVHRFDSVGSTNDEAFRIAQETGLHAFWVRADRQTRARGRRGRPWQSGEGNLLASAFVTLNMNTVVDWLPLASGLALHDAITDCDPSAHQRVRLKWPNDLLIDRRKISGILLEARVYSGCRQIVIGFGVNIANAPSAEDIERPAISLTDAGISGNPDQLMTALTCRFAVRMEQVLAAAHDTIRSDWLAQAVGLGEAIEVRLPNTTHQGRFINLAADGRLVLALASGETYEISAGDVFFAGHN